MTGPLLDHPALTDYLSRLREAGSSLPPGRADDLEDDIRRHVSDALPGGQDTDGAVMGVLDRLGPPEDIIAAEGIAAPQQLTAPPARALPARDDSSRRWGALEVLAVTGLLLGPFIPVIATVTGLILTWCSPAWNRRDKAVATSLVALAHVVPLLLIVAATATGEDTVRAFFDSPLQLVLLMGVVSGVLGSVGAVVYLGISLTRRHAASTDTGSGRL